MAKVTRKNTKLIFPKLKIICILRIRIYVRLIKLLSLNRYYTKLLAAVTLRVKGYIRFHEKYVIGRRKIDQNARLSSGRRPNKCT